MKPPQENLFEFALDKEFEPCRFYDYLAGKYCLNRERCIRLVPSNHGRKLVCGRGHSHPHNGKPFIPGYEFADGGEFAGVLPDYLVPSEEKLRRSRWKISQITIDALEDVSACLHCDTPPLNTVESTSLEELWMWLESFDKNLHHEVKLQLVAAAPFDFNDWFLKITTDLRSRIIIRTNQSLLNYDHAIPRKLGDKHWHRLSTSARKVLQDRFVIRLCGKCNGAKTSTLWASEHIISMYASARYEGSIAAAIADTDWWPHIQEVLNVFYERATG